MSYNIDDTPTAGVNPSFNAWKSGDPSPFTNGTCDGNYMNQMIGQAHLQANREITMNATVIRKPDSVLEYTCFDQFIGVTANMAGVAFSESTAFSPKNIELQTADQTQIITYASSLPSDSLDNALKNLLLDALKGYMVKNFSHSYLGGSSGIDNSLDYTTIRGGGYNCAHMDAVWKLAHCTNFGEDGKFFSFGQLIEGDPRQLPSACFGKPAPELNKGAPENSILDGDFIGDTYRDILDSLSVATITETNPCPTVADADAADIKLRKNYIRLSNNCDFKFTAMEVATNYFEYLKTPFDILDPSNSDPLDATRKNALIPLCGDPVPTGMKVPIYIVTELVDPIYGINTVTNIGDGALSILTFDIPGIDYDEHICINPGCVFVPKVNVCVPRSGIP